MDTSELAPADRRWERLIDEFRAAQDAPAGSHSIWWSSLRTCLVGGLGALVLLAGANVLVSDTAVGGLPPNAVRAAHHACSLPGGNVTSITLDGGHYAVTCSWAPFGWPSGSGSMACADGEWGGSSAAWGEWTDYGVSCTGKPSIYDGVPGPP